MQNRSQYSVEDTNPEDVIISSRDIDSNYEPSIEEIKQYGIFLGMNLEEDMDFLYIAKKGLKAAVPAPWKACQTKDGQIYYFNFETGESQWEHPCDEECRREFQLAKGNSLLKHDRTENMTHSQLRQTQIIDIIDERSNSQSMITIQKDKAQEIDDIEREFAEELKKFEKELSLKYEQETSEFKKAEQIQTELENVTQEENGLIEIDQEIEVIQDEMKKKFEQESQVLEAQSAQILEDEIRKLRSNYDVSMNSEIMKLRSAEMDAERSKALTQGSNIEEKPISRLLKEYNNRFFETQAEYQNKLEREILEFKCQKEREYSEKYLASNFQLRGNHQDELNFQNLKKEYKDAFEKEKQRLHFLAQKSIEGLYSRLSMSDIEKDIKHQFDNKFKAIENEKIQHIRQVHNSLDAHQRQLQRMYELGKLALQNSSNQHIQSAQREIKNIERDLKIKENIINSSNLLKDEAQVLERELAQKENLICEFIVKIKETEMLIQEQNMQIQHYQQRAEARRLPTNNKAVLLQKIADMNERLDIIQNELKAFERERINSEDPVSSSQNIGKFLRELKSIKNAIIQKNKRKSSVPTQKLTKNALNETGLTNHLNVSFTQNSEFLEKDISPIYSNKERRSASTGKQIKTDHLSTNNYTSVGSDLQKSYGQEGTYYLSSTLHEKMAIKNVPEYQQTNGSLLNSFSLGLRDTNIQRESSHKKASNLYGRRSLQNTSEIIINKSDYPRDTYYSKKTKWESSIKSKPLYKQELIGSVQLRSKFKDEKIFRQYDNLIRKYTSK